MIAIPLVLILLILLITVPLLELMVLLWLAEVTSFWFTVATVVATGILGTLVARSQGLAVWQRIRSQLRAGQMPAGAVTDAAMIFVAGVTLVVPGLLTDALGFALLVPACRVWIKQRVMNWIQRRYHLRTPGGHAPRSQIVDSHVVSNPPEE